MLLILGLMVACSPPGPKQEAEQIRIEVVDTDNQGVAFNFPQDYEFIPGSRLVSEGLGGFLEPGDRVLLRVFSQVVGGNEPLRDSFTTLPEVRDFVPERIGAEVYNALMGTRIGSRVIIESETELGQVVTVVESQQLRAVGLESEVPLEIGTVERAEDGEPTFSPDLAATLPSITTVQQIIQGPGAQLRAGDETLIQYVMYGWPSGEQIETTWQGDLRAIPLVAGSGTLLGDALIEQSAGSQVVVIVPFQELVTAGVEVPEGELEAYIFVVDILWVTPLTVDAESEIEEAS